MQEKNDHTPGLSVVIATLGGDWLINTINSLLGGTMVPDEILICIPDDRMPAVKHLASDIVKIELTGVKGQVKQRAVGFQRCRYSMVLQLDDDILLETDTIRKLTSRLGVLGEKNAVAPVYYGKRSGKCIHALENGIAKNLFDKFICGAPWGVKKMGVVTTLGLNYGVDDMHCKMDTFPVQWLPGGCVLSYKDDLIANDFFPFTGKAYCEDVYHSYYRKMASVNMWVLTGTKVMIDEPVPEFSETAVEKVISIRRQYVNLTHGSRWRLAIYELFSRVRSRLMS